MDRRREVPDFQAHGPEGVGWLTPHYIDKKPVAQQQVIIAGQEEPINTVPGLILNKQR